ncbi:EMB2654, partial [Symbiodinium sp. KB8]
DLSKYGRLEYADAVSCEPATTPFVQRALANKMFSHCGAWCIYDYYQPDKISYHWDATRKCFSQTGLCLEKYKNEMEKAVAKKQLICTEEEPCVPVAPSLTNSVSLRYCNSLSTNKEDRSQDARGCHESYTPYVRRALANNLFSHCGAFCLYDFDQPDKVSYSYDTTRKCWHRGSGCQDNPEQKLAIAKKAKTCKADLCIPVQTSHSDQATLTYCQGLKVNGADRSGSAKACNSANTAKVHKALANKMYNHCGAWCLYDFERPEKAKKKGKQLKGVFLADGPAAMDEPFGGVGWSAVAQEPNVVALSSSISTAAKAWQWPAALKLFSTIQKLEARPNEVTFGAAISSEKSWSRALFRLFHMPSFGLTPNAICTNTAISSYEASQWQSSIKLISDMRRTSLRPTKITMNASMNTCGAAGLWHSMLHLLSRMTQQKLLPDSISFNTAISTAGPASLWPVATRLLSGMQARDVAPDNISINAASSACQKSGHWQPALCLLGAMPARRLWPDVVSFTSVISALGCEQCGTWEATVCLLPPMARAEILPNVLSFNAVSRSLSSHRQWQRVLEQLPRMQMARLTPDSTSFYSSLLTCADRGLWQSSCKFLVYMGRAEIPLTASMLNVVVSAGATGGPALQWKLAWRLLWNSAPGIKGADVACLTAVMAWCERGEQWERAVSLFAEYRRSMGKLNEVCFGAVISAYAKGSGWQTALQLLGNMPGASTRPNAVCINAAISSCEASGEWSLAISLLCCMPAMALEADAISFSAALSASGKCAKWHLARTLLSKSMRFSSDMVCTSAAINALGKGGAWLLAWQVLSEVSATRAEPNRVALSAAISACASPGKWQLALWPLSRMHLARVLVTENIFSAEMHAAGRSSEWTRALQMLSAVSTVGAELSIISFNTVISACDEAGQWKAALHVFSQRHPNEISFNAAISACNFLRSGL